jgi:hypothetical protein
MWQALGQRLEEGILEIVRFVPRLLAALGILMAGFAIAKMLERGTDAALHRIGFDKWMREGGMTEALDRLPGRLDPSSMVGKLVFWTVMLLVIVLSADALGIATVNTLFREIFLYIPSVIAAVIVLVIGIVIGQFMKDLVLASAGGLPGGITLARAAKASVILLAVFMALDQLEIAEDIVLVTFIAVVGAASIAAGIAFGLGGKEIASEISRQWYERMKLQRDVHWDDIANPPPPTQQPTSPPRLPDVGNPPPNETRG